MGETKKTIDRARQYGYLLLRYRPRSVKEFYQRLIKKGFADETANKVIEEFKRRGLLDDKKFAEVWVSERISLKPAGKSLIKRELKIKGINSELIDRALEGAKPFYDEQKIAKELAEKRFRILGKLEKQKKKRRVYAYLARRGFSSDAIWKAINEIFTNAN